MMFDGFFKNLMSALKKARKKPVLMQSASAPKTLKQKTDMLASQEDCEQTEQDEPNGSQKCSLVPWPEYAQRDVPE